MLLLRLSRRLAQLSALQAIPCNCSLKPTAAAASVCAPWRCCQRSASVRLFAGMADGRTQDAMQQLHVPVQQLQANAPSLCKVAVAQMTSVADQDANYETCERLAEEAASAGCSMLFLPECFSFIGNNQYESLAKAEPLDGPTMERYRQLARSKHLWLSLGGFQEKGPDDGHLYNTHVILNDNGRTVAVYRKIHLFDVDVPKGPVLMESRTTAPGNQVCVCDSPAGKLGVTICYDLRFPELYQHLTWELGARVLLVPSAFTAVTGAAHWEVLLRARAIECQAYVIAAAQAGRHNEKRESYGHSLIIDPWGTVIGRLEDPYATGIAVAELDAGVQNGVRLKMPIDKHRAQGRQLWVQASQQQQQQQQVHLQEPAA